MGNHDPIFKNDEIVPENEPISHLLGTLKRVEAPGDFDFRVRAGIAERRVADVQTSWVPLRAVWAAPVSLSLLVGGYFAFNSFYFPAETTFPQVAEVRSTQAASSLGLPTEESIVVAPFNIANAEKPEGRPPGPAERHLRVPATRRVSAPTRIVNPLSGGSFDEASKEGTMIYPRGLDPKRTITAAPGEIENGSKIHVKDVLKFIGIEARYTSSGWTVGSVAANNLGDRSGIRPGDVIEAINDEVLDGATAFGSAFNGRSLRIRRDGKVQLISLKP